MVLGNDMMPEFEDGTIITIDPGYPLKNGAYVDVAYDDDVYFRQYKAEGNKSFLLPLNPKAQVIELFGDWELKGTVTQSVKKRNYIFYEYSNGAITRKHKTRGVHY